MKESDEKEKRLELKEDYYALTWCSFITKYQVEYALTQDEVYGHFFKCTFICLIQMLLIVLVFIGIEKDLSKEVTPTLLMMRFICLLILHIQIEQEVRQTLSMFKYQNNHPGKFKDCFAGDSTLLPATLVVVMQLGSSIATEVISLLLIMDATSEKDCLMNFLAIQIVSQIDEIYFSTIRREPLKEAVTENSPEINNSTKMLRASGRSKAQWGARKLYKAFKFLHATYFYFLPLLIPIIAFMSPELQYIQDLAQDIQDQLINPSNNGTTPAY